MANWPNLIVRISRAILRHRWLAMILAGSIFIAFEVIEYMLSGERLSIDFVPELLIFGVVLPLIGGTVLTLLARTEAERIRAVQHVDFQRQLGRQLSNAHSWDELTTTLVQFPRTVVPLVGASLLVYDQHCSHFELAAEWRDAGEHAPRRPAPSQASGAGLACALAHMCSLHTSLNEGCPTEFGISNGRNAHCLPLAHGDSLVALLHLSLPPNVALAESQVEVLNHIAPSMALAIDSARPGGSAIMRAEVTEAERRRIARELHDTLGQSLGYLRLRLDQLAEGDALQEISVIQQELVRMRGIADEAYNQVRGTLATLHPSNSADLGTALLGRAKLVGDQAAFEVELTSEGHSRALSALIQHQVLLLFQEALTNVAKHSHAQHVGIHFTWGADDLTITLSDDGQGFEPDTIQPNGHYGLAMMQERAEEVNGSLTLASRPRGGTEITLRLPIK